MSRVIRTMHKRQKTILTEFIAVVVVTAIAVVTMINAKDLINRSEAMGAMRALAEEVRKYRDEHGSLPPESWIDKIKENLPGQARLGDLQYRALWIDFASTPDEILAYTERSYHSLFVGKGYVVLRLGAVLRDDISDDEHVEWMDKQEFETLLAQQQSQKEIEMLRDQFE